MFSSSRYGPAIHKVYNHFGSKQRIRSRGVSLFQHKLFRIIKPQKGKHARTRRNNKTWIAKFCDIHLYYAVIEQTAQEFFRLIMPWQPKTRICFHDGNIYLLSEEIVGFISFDNVLEEEGYDVLKKKIFSAREYLAGIIIIALFLNESDLKNANVGFSREGKIIKIDGEFCFTKNYDKTSNTITPDDLKSLPKLISYSPYNWFDYIRADVNHDDCEFFDENLNQDNEFRNAINKTILKIIILPSQFIKAFIESYDSFEELTDIMIERREMLTNAALRCDSFIDYLEQSENDYFEYMEQLKRFKTMSKFVLWDHLEDADTLFANTYFRLMILAKHINLNFIENWCIKFNININEEYAGGETLLSLSVKQEAYDVVIYLLNTNVLRDQLTSK
ncbi:MAG: hypothetical protein P4M12_07405 [Gammaproteobacteria bacterium]|nr:hypothetical protein [Gammaproteobacteria bacterium]